MTIRRLVYCVQCKVSLFHQKGKPEICFWFSFYLGLEFAEPTSNVAPRIAGERYDGGKLHSVPLNKTIAMVCAVQGSPVPFTRYNFCYSVLFGF